MLDKLRAWLYRIGFNLFPAYRGTGARITHIEPDWSEIRAKVPLNWRTRNYVGVTFGGSMYGAVDPLYARCRITDEELDAIRAELREEESTERVYTTRLVDEEETVHATVRKTVYVSTDQSKAT